MTIEVIEALLVDIAVVILLVMPVLGLWATVYMWRLWRSDPRRPRSWVLFAMASAATAIGIVSIPIAWLAYRRIVQAETLPPYVALLILASVLLVLESIPIYFGLTIYRKRNGISLRSDRETDV